MKVLYLVLSAPYEPWESLFHNGIAQTWVKEEMALGKNSVFLSLGKSLPHPSNVVINRFLQSKYGVQFWSTNVSKRFPVKIEDKITLRSARYERWDNLLGKFLDCAAFTLNHYDFDYIVRVNTTTHVNSETLLRLLEKKSFDYGGCRIKSEDCAAGWAMIFSRELIKKLTTFDFSDLDLKGRYEDGVLCAAIKQRNITFQPFQYISWPTDGGQFDSEELKQYPFIRVKQVTDKFRVDDTLHLELWRKLNSSNRRMR